MNTHLPFENGTAIDEQVKRGSLCCCCCCCEAFSPSSSSSSSPCPCPRLSSLSALAGRGTWNGRLNAGKTCPRTWKRCGGAPPIKSGFVWPRRMAIPASTGRWRALSGGQMAADAYGYRVVYTDVVCVCVCVCVCLLAFDCVSGQRGTTLSPFATAARSACYSGRRFETNPTGSRVTCCLSRRSRGRRSVLARERESARCVLWFRWVLRGREKKTRYVRFASAEDDGARDAEAAHDHSGNRLLSRAQPHLGAGVVPELYLVRRWLCV